ncbi:flagellar biosynthesis protein FlhB [Opacimonas viscosa]|uniref:Flagellar biosynthetic protein FlhB n=1 Tax=Opacimonas viscosa TaxID=2961944 RepID=A0AA41X1N5_9ALTE|nr:flagellar biosynthesis protein FlhB [Opacimonas viscosa]MCP3427836.1 flagellar biosynthesis protein FlhB [Opacimonas viscosa]
MAQDDFDKTEEPTDKKIEDARKEGQVARSMELSTALVLISSALGFMFFGSFIASAVFGLTERTFTLSRDETYDTTHMFQAWGWVIDLVQWPVLMFLVVSLVGGVYGNIALGGFNFTWKGAAPKMTKISPVSGFKRMFGVNALVELGKSIAKIVVILSAAYFALLFFKDEALHLDQELFPANIFHAIDMLEWAFLILTLAMLPIVAIDVPFQVYKYTKDLKMSKQEVKDERKNAEGDPMTKSRVRRLQYQAAANRMMQDVPEADVIITNPTHYSVAIKYDQDGERAPVMVAKGIDELAMHIRTVASAHGVMLIPSPMLARAIYYSTEINQEVPQKLFMAVAQVLAYVYQLKAYKSGKAQRPKALSKSLPIPPELRR